MTYIVFAMMEYEVEASSAEEAAAKVRELGGDIRGTPYPAEARDYMMGRSPQGLTLTRRHIGT